MADPTETGRAGRGSARVGTVGTVGGQKTIHVIVNSLVKHPAYGKYVRRRTKLAVHDPQGQAEIGDVVEIVPCRRVSKTKSWRLVRVLRRGDVVAAAPEQPQEE
jgi:small subunit ribosomal protein S17